MSEDVKPNEILNNTLIAKAAAYDFLERKLIEIFHIVRPLCISVADAKGKLRPIKNTSKQEIYKAIVEIENKYREILK